MALDLAGGLWVFSLGSFDEPQDIELMAQRQDLCFQRGPRSKKSDQRAPDQPAKLAHRADDSPDSLPLANRIKVCDRDTQSGHAEAPYTHV